MTLKRELSQIAKSTSNPVSRSLCEMAVNKALQQLDNILGAEPFTEATNSTDTNPEENPPKDTSPQNTNPKSFDSLPRNHIRDNQIGKSTPSRKNT